MKLINRADGIKGHYCIGRPMEAFNTTVWEFWNKDKWRSVGEVFTCREIALKKLEELRQCTKEVKGDDKHTT